MTFSAAHQTPVRVRLAQLQLVCGNGGHSVLPTMVLLAMLFGVLSHPDNAWRLGLWCSLVAASMLHWWWYATRQLAKPALPEELPRKTTQLVLLHAIDGALWGALPWVAMDGATVTGLVLIMAVLTGVAANSMSLLSPVVAVYAGFVLAQMLVACAKMLSMSDPSYWVFSAAGLLFTLVMLGQAFSNARSARTTISLRFENSELLEKLRGETELAQAARRDAEHANSAKSTFLAAASHDLRQPIHAQGLFLDILSRSGLTPAQNEVLVSAMSASRATSDMLNTLLDFSRIEAGVVEPHVRAFDVQTLLRAVENDLAPSADAKGLVYRTRSTDAALKMAFSDAVLVELILRNLVSNAIRYTDAGGVLVACRRRGAALALEVWDTGIGIAPESHAEIFREFHQLGNAERDRRKGLGLGLAIAQGLAKTLRHSLTLASTVARGSVFRLELPIDPDLHGDPALAQNRHPAAMPEPGTALAGLHVLVIDDDEAVRQAMVQLLHTWGCLCSSAAGVDEALQEVLQEVLQGEPSSAARTDAPIDVVICDYRLREARTGTQAITALRQHLGRPLPALLITGDTAPERLQQALASNIPLLHKPVDAAALYAALVSLLRRGRPQDPL